VLALEYSLGKNTYDCVLRGMNVIGLDSRTSWIWNRIW